MYSCVKAWIAHLDLHAEHAGISHRCEGVDNHGWRDVISTVSWLASQHTEHQTKTTWHDNKNTQDASPEVSSLEKVILLSL